MKKHQLKTTAAKNIVFLLLIIAAYILQFIIIPKTSFPFPVFNLIPLVTAISMHEKEFAGLFWGITAGILWDMASPVTDGAFTLFFAVLFLLAGLLTRYILRNTILTAAILTAVIALCPIAFNLFYFNDGLTRDIFIFMLKDSIIPCSIISVLLSIPAYFTVHGINAHFHKERQ